MLKSYLANMNFEWPMMLWLLALLPVMIWWLTYKKGNKPATFKTSTLQTGLLHASWKTRLRHLPDIIRLMAIVPLVVAIARPVEYEKIELNTGEGIDVMLCLDVSGSMLARDFVPDRLGASVEVARNFVKNRKGDRIGLIIFSGQSFTLCPLTTDHAALQTQLSSINYGMLADGTAIGSGLASAVDRLRDAPSKSKIVVLLTDGENTGGLIDPQTAKLLAKNFNIKVYTIGVGSEGYAPMPYKTQSGVTVMENEKVSIDEKLLKEIADETGGQYFRAIDKESLENIYANIDQLEKSKIETTIFNKRTELFFPWAMAALLLLLLEWALRYSVFRKFP